MQFVGKTPERIGKRASPLRFCGKRTILMNKRKTIYAALLAVFVLLAAHYALNPARRATQHQLEPAGSHTTKDDMLSSLDVTTIAQDNRRLVWIGTSAGINVYDGENFTQFFHDSKDTTALPDDYINVLHRDRHGHMWVGTQNGLARYEGANRFCRIALPDAHANVTAIADAPQPADEAAVVVTTGRGRFLVSGSRVSDVSADSAMASKLHGAPHDTLPASANNSLVLRKPIALVQAIYRDADNNTWVGYRNAGYQVVSDNQTAYLQANNNRLASATEGLDVTSLETMGQHILAGTTLRLFVYDTATDRLSYRLYDELFGEHQVVGDLVALDRSRVWLVGKHRLLCCEVQGDVIKVVGGAFAKGHAGCDMGCGVMADGCVYVSCSDGHLVRHRFGAPQAELLDVKSQWYDDETQMAVLHDGNILLFMRNMHFAVFHPQTGRISPLNVSGAPQYGNIDPAFVRQDSHGSVWLGTKRSGLYRLDLKQRRLQRMTFVDDVHIQALAEDRCRQLWITTLKDAVCFQPATGAVLMNSLVSSRQNEWNRQFFDNSICVAPNGDMVLGCSDGCKFVSTSVRAGQPDDMAHLCIYRIGVQTAQGHNLIVNDSIADGSRYTFDHDENTLDFSFFYPNYNRRSSLMFQYKLDGYDNDWHAPTYRHEARYANMSPGDYTFRLRVVASPSLPPIAERTVVISVRHAPWASAAAWYLYAVCALLLIGFINHLYLRIRTNRIQLLHEQNEREREQRTNEMNMNFFANISHEFRNPITIIAGPLLALKADPTLPQNVQTTLNRVCMSVNRMLRLIDQMLDFNQLETDALRLKVQPTDATAEMQRLAATFCESTKVRGISLETRLPDAAPTAWLDTDKLEKIMSNLFTNALKHTPDGGTIRIMMTAADTLSVADTPTATDRLAVTVFNSGSHIDDDRLDDVFKRYYQLPGTHTGHHYSWGTGIGLYYVKRLVCLHHGTISVANTADGVEFRFVLPTARACYAETEMADDKPHVLQLPVDPLPAAPQTSAAAPAAAPPVAGAEDGGRQQPKILIVDDDIDVAQYIRSVFAADYVVENRYSAEVALADMADIAPDIVLSDVVMGSMTGYELCRRLKGDLMFSHIPVVLVTAKTDMNEQIDGLNMGAVAYVTKPFDPSYLRALVKSQLANVQLLRRRLGESTDTVTVASQLSAEDRQFMDELYGYMEQRAAEQELNVSTVCRDLLISQSKFNYKLKQLTGDTPGAFFRKYKLNKAAAMLREGTHTVAEVSTLTGFGSPAHFSVAFKKQFGVSPSEY